MTEKQREKPRIESARVSFGPAPAGDPRGASGGSGMRTAWVGPLLGARDEALGPEAVDKDSFPALLARWRPSVRFTVPNHTGSGPRGLTLDLTFEQMRAFSPEAVIESVVELRGLAGARRTLERIVDEPLDLDTIAIRLKADGADPQWADDFERALKHTQRGGPTSPPTTAPSEGDPRLAGLLEMVDLPGQETVAAAASHDAFKQLVATVAGASGRQRGLEKSIAREAVAQLDRVIGVQLAEIIHHPDFMALETAWRDLKFVVDRTDFRRGNRLDVLAAPKAELAQAVHDRLYRPEHDRPREPGLAAVWIDVEFDASVRDVEVLRLLSRMGESLQIPLVAGVGPAFFGVKAARQVSALSPLWDHMKRPEFIPFEALRGEESAPFVGLVFPRMLSRMPYGRQGKPTAGLSFDEDPEGTLPWGGGVAALAACVATSHAEHGWPAAILGQSHGGLVENLPLARIRLDDDQHVHAPLDAVLGDTIIEELSEAGFIVLASSPNDDRAFVAAAPCIGRVPASDDAGARRAAMREASLPYRLVAARVAGALRTLVARATGIDSDQALSAYIEAGLRAALDLEGGDRLAVEVQDDGSGQRAVGIHLRLPVVLMGAEVEMELGIVIGG